MYMPHAQSHNAPQNTAIPAVCMVLVLCAASALYAFTRVENHGQVNHINDVLVAESTVWAATNGGMFEYNLESGESTLHHGADVFTDLAVSALCRDRRGTIWAGTESGYLYSIMPGGRTQAFTYYTSSDTSGNAEGWRITDLYAYGDHIVICSPEGISFFHTTTHEIKNVTQIADYTSSITYSALVYRETLFVAARNGIATLPLQQHPIATFNNYDKSVWDTLAASADVRYLAAGDTSVATSPYPLLRDGDALLYAADTMITMQKHDDTLTEFALPSTISCIDANQQTRVIGTGEDYLYLWRDNAGADAVEQITIPGLTFQFVNRVQSDQRGNVWMLSRGDKSSDDLNWWKGATWFNGLDTWRHFGREHFGSFAANDNNADFHGLCVARDNSVWLGTPKGGVKRFMPQDSSWTRYYLGPTNKETSPYYPQLSIRGGWNQSNAIAQDSAGNIWLGGFLNKSGNLVCWNARTIEPHEDDYYRFFPYASPHYIENAWSIEVAAENTVYAGGREGTFIMIRYNGDPVKGEITAASEKLNATILDIAPGKGDSCWIVTTKGVFCKYPDNGTSQSGVDFRVEKQKEMTSALTGGAACMAYEHGRSLWFGTRNGLLINWRRGPLEQGDSLTDTVTTFNAMDGLVVNAQITDLAIDRSRGHLWIASDAGISRMLLGHEFSTKADKAAMEVFPNPFSLSNASHSTLTFTKCPSGSRVVFYTLDGTRITSLHTPRLHNKFGATFEWNPRNHCAPGVYIAVAHSPQGRDIEKVMINP